MPRAARPEGPSPRRSSWFTIGRVHGTVVVTVHGHIELEDWARIDDLIRDLIDGQGNLDLVVDLWDISHIERAAMPMIVDAARHAHARGGRLRIADRACQARSWRSSQPVA